MNRESKIRWTVFELFRQNKTPQEIVQITGLSKTAVYRFKREYEGRKEIPTGHISKKVKFWDDWDKTVRSLLGGDAPLNFEADWTEAVNRIRRYCGKEELRISQL